MGEAACGATGPQARTTEGRASSTRMQSLHRLGSHGTAMTETRLSPSEERRQNWLQNPRQQRWDQRDPHPTCLGQNLPTECCIPDQTILREQEQNFPQQRELRTYDCDLH